ncbi:unnamed protein product, partial [Prorocentrum cordatum]
ASLPSSLPRPPVRREQPGRARRGKDRKEGGRRERALLSRRRISESWLGQEGVSADPELRIDPDRIGVTCVVGVLRSLGALAHLAALLLQAAGALLLPLPPEHRPGLLVRVRLVSHGRGRRRLL